LIWLNLLTPFPSSVQSFRRADGWDDGILPLFPAVVPAGSGTGRRDNSVAAELRDQQEGWMRRLILAAAAALALTGAADAQAVRIGTEGHYTPWNFLDQSGNVAGFEIELGNELCKRAGLECSWVVNAWDTIIPNLLAGNYDAIMAGMAVTDERKESIDFSDNYFPLEPSRYVAAAGKSLDFGNLQGVRIGVHGGTIQSAYAEETFSSGNTIVSFESADEAVAGLKAGDVDVVLGNGSYIAGAIAGSSGALELVGPDVVIGGAVAIGLRKADDELETKLNAAIGAMKQDGSLDALISKWFPDKGPGPFFE